MMDKLWIFICLFVISGVIAAAIAIVQTSKDENINMGCEDETSDF